MILAAALKALVLLAVTFGFLLPLAVAMEYRHHPVLRARIGSSREGSDDDISVWEPLRPAGRALALLIVEGPPGPGPHPVLRRLAPGLALVAAVFALAVLPFGAGSYRFGETPVSLVVADLDWGVLAALVALGFAQLADVVVAWGSGSAEGRLFALRGSVRMLAGAAATALAVAGLLLCFGTLGLSELAAVQDASFRVLGFLEKVGFTETLSPWLSWLRLPSWGVFVQPLGSVLFLACAVVGFSRPVPPDSGNAPDALRIGPFLTASFLERIVWAAFLTVLFLGGGAIPWFPGEAIVGFVARAYGEGFATGFAMLLHAGTFFAKVAVVLAGLAWLRARFADLGHERAMTLLCRWILPLGFANAAATALAIFWWDGLAG